MKDADKPLEHLRTFRMNRCHIPKLGPGFHHMKAHWMSSHFLSLAENFSMTEDEYIAFLDSGEGYNLEVFETDLPTPGSARALAVEAVQCYFENADVSDVEQNADYHARMVVTLVEDAIKKKLESL